MDVQLTYGAGPDDVRVLVDGVETPRWLSDDGRVWAHIEMKSTSKFEKIIWRSFWPITRRLFTLRTWITLEYCAFRNNLDALVYSVLVMKLNRHDWHGWYLHYLSHRFKV